jgi:hypothetical protein
MENSQSDYIKQLEADNERLQTSLTDALTTINEWLKIVCHSTNKKIIIITLFTLHNFVPEEGKRTFKSRAEPKDAKLCTAIVTTVDEVPKWILTYSDGTIEQADIGNTPTDIVDIVKRKYNLMEVPVELEIDLTDLTDFTRIALRDSAYASRILPPIVSFPPPPAP